MKEKILKLPITVRIIAPLVVLGLCIGLGIGLYIGWMAWPLQITSVNFSDLKGSAQEDYIVLTAKTFAYDQNLDAALERLNQLNDVNISDRVANLAIVYASQSRPESAQLAALAVAMGSTKEGIALLAHTLEPVAQAIIPTDSPTTIPTPSATPPVSPTSITSATRTATRRLTPTATKPPAAPIAPTSFFPGDLQKGWPGGFHVEPASAAPGQQYWHLIKAIYCDITETQFGCTGKSGDPLPGGPGTIGVWVKLVGGKAPLILNDKPANLEDKSQDTQCQCTYSLDFPGPTIEVSGHPSDKIFGAANGSVHVGFPNTHVRYFFTYQLITR